MQHQTNTTQNQQADKFTLTDAYSGIRIVFLPQTLRGNQKIPQLDYQGAEGEFTFRGDEVKQQQSHLGLLISIVLKTNTDDQELIFTLMLPSVNLASQKRQEFETVAIATTKSRKVVARAGIQFNCQVFTLKGCAENLSMVPPLASAGWQNPSWFPHNKRHEDLYNLMDFQRF